MHLQVGLCELVVDILSQVQIATVDASGDSAGGGGGGGNGSGSGAGAVGSDMPASASQSSKSSRDVFDSAIALGIELIRVDRKGSQRRL